MIVGVGVDIVEIKRIIEALERNNNFLEKVFTDVEIEYLKSRKLKAEHVAGRFAAKEAVSKALGTGIRGFGFRDIEIDRNELGKPIAVLKGNARLVAEQYGDYNLQLSISHGQDSAIAYVILEIVSTVGGERNEDRNFNHNE